MKGVRYSKGKPRMELIPPYAERQIAIGFTWGAQKYSDHNWMLGGPDLTYLKLIGSLRRHINSFICGEEIDEESGVHNLALAGCNIMMLLEMTHIHPEMDDRPCKLSDEQMAIRKTDVINESTDLTPTPQSVQREHGVTVWLTPREPNGWTMEGSTPDEP